MAKRRMMSTQITDSDEFISLSSSAQALYMHLNNSADDDGFNNQVQMAMLKAHASADDLRVLLLKRFLIQFESGVIVLKHWRMVNAIRKDRYTPTVYQEEFKQLRIKENGAYTLSTDEPTLLSETSLFDEEEKILAKYIEAGYEESFVREVMAMLGATPITEKNMALAMKVCEDDSIVDKKAYIYSMRMGGAFDE